MAEFCQRAGGRSHVWPRRRSEDPNSKFPTIVYTGLQSAVGVGRDGLAREPARGDAVGARPELSPKRPDRYVQTAHEGVEGVFRAERPRRQHRSRCLRPIRRRIARSAEPRPKRWAPVEAGACGRRRPRSTKQYCDLSSAVRRWVPKPTADRQQDKVE
jgi:hypothetical protein